MVQVGLHDGLLFSRDAASPHSVCCHIIAQLSSLFLLLQAVEANIRSLEAQFSEATAKKESLSQQVAECTIKLTRAEKLIGGLGGERSRWQATIEQLAQASH